MKTDKIFRLSIVSQLIALMTHCYLAYQHYVLKYGQSEGKSLCNISDYLNCDSVAMSAYSVVLGVPLALWGVIINLLLLVMIVLSQNSPLFRRQAQILSFLTAGASIVMGIITLTKLQTACIFCISAYLFSFITLLCVQKLNKNNPLSLSAAISGSFAKPVIKQTFVYVFVPIILAFLLNSMVVTNMAKGVDQAVAAQLNAWKTGKDVNLSQAKGLTLGADPAKAKMVIVEFADFQCIHCKMAAPTLKSFVRSRNDVTLIFQSFPLDGQCNPAIKEAGNGKSCDLAKAVYCANLQGKGWNLHEWVFEHHGAELDQVSAAAEQLGIDMASFNSCRSSEETKQIIMDQAKLGIEAGIKGTPGIFVNGRELPGGQFLLVLEAAYKELSK